MTNPLIQAVANALRAVEIATEDNEAAVDFIDTMTNIMTYYETVIARSDRILDQRKEKVYRDTLNLNTRGDLERAMSAYTEDYLIGLNLSLDATSELAKELIVKLKRYDLPAPQAWINVANFDTAISQIRTKLKHVRQVPDL